MKSDPKKTLNSSDSHADRKGRPPKKTIRSLNNKEPYYTQKTISSKNVKQQDVSLPRRVSPHIYFSTTLRDLIVKTDLAVVFISSELETYLRRKMLKICKERKIKSVSEYDQTLLTIVTAELQWTDLPSSTSDVLMKRFVTSKYQLPLDNENVQK